MTRKNLAGLIIAAGIVLVRPGTAAGQALSNGLIRAEFRGAQLVRLTDVRSGFEVSFDDESFSVTADGERIDRKSLGKVRCALTPQKVNCTFPAAGLRHKVSITYELQPDWRFLSKQITIEPAGAADFRVNEITASAAAIGPAIGGELPLPTSRAARGSWGSLLRFARDNATSSKPAFGMFMLCQNPFNVWKREGQSVAISYAPEIDWKQAYGPFFSDRLCIGIYPLSGIEYPAAPISEWTFVGDYAKYLAENPRIDVAETDSLVECVRSFLLYRPQKSARVHVPWCENDYQIDVSNPEGWQEYQRVISRAAEVGCQYTLFTPANSALSSLKDNEDAWGWENLLFFALGQKIRKGEWDPAKNPVPASLQKMLDFARSEKIKLVSYSYPSLAFMKDPAWTEWAAGKAGGYNGADTGLRSFQDWWIGKLVDFVKATGAGGFSFDHWWIAYDNASSKYAQWYGCRRILQTLRLRIPDIFIDGRQQYMNFGPWTWLAGTYPHPSLTDEQPESFVSFPDLHTDRVSADRQRFAAWTYRMQRFAPPEILPGFIAHQTERSDAKKVMRRDRFRPRDWDLLGWKFSVLSSIGTAPFNHVVNYLPARDLDEFRAFSEDDKRWLRDWFTWTDANAEVLRHLKPIIGPPAIGRVDGTAAVSGGRGFVFLFNPNYRQLDAEFVLDESMGLDQGTTFVLEELYPEKGLLVGDPQNGIWTRGARVRLTMGGNEAIVLQVRPTSDPVSKPVLFNVRGTSSLSGGSLVLTDVEGEIGSKREVTVLLRANVTVSSMTVNGERTRYRQEGRLVTASIHFAGERFSRSQGLWTYDPNFAGGAIMASFRIPPRIFDQLQRRKLAWPVPYTEDDLIAPWLGSFRLLMFAQTAEPDDTKEFKISIDGKSVQVRRAYNNIYGNNKRTFLGSYVDVSLLEPDREHVVEVTVPSLAAGRFQGLFFENIEPEYTRRIATGTGAGTSK